MGGHLEFALKWEGVDLGVLDALFRTIDSNDITAVIRTTPTGVYARRLWFLFEWLTQHRLDLPDAGKVRAVPALSPDQQFALAEGVPSSRHRVIDNLPGTPAFCPLIRRTPTLERFGARGLDRLAREVVGRAHPDVLARAAAFLLLSDSRSSFYIEGERPSAQRAARWGQAIGEAGVHPLTWLTWSGCNGLSSETPASFASGYETPVALSALMTATPASLSPTISARALTICTT